MFLLVVVAVDPNTMYGKCWFAEAKLDGYKRFFLHPYLIN